MCKISHVAFLLYLAVFAVVGCKPNHRYVYENFNVSSMDAHSNAMSCSISLNGSEQYEEVDTETGANISYLKSPYTVFVSFLFPKEQSGMVDLKELSFYVGDSKVKSEIVTRKEKFDNKTEFRRGGVLQVREEEESRASFLIKKVEIPHSKLTVKVTALISTEQGEILKTWTFELTPFTEEKTRNDQLDSIMSV